MYIFNIAIMIVKKYDESAELSFLIIHTDFIKSNYTVNASNFSSLTMNLIANTEHIHTASYMYIR